MPVSAVVITLQKDPSRQEAALEALKSDPRVELGLPQGLHLPAVLTTDSLGEGIGLVKQELLDVEGVSFVRVVRVDFDDADAAAESQGGWNQVRDRPKG